MPSLTDSAVPGPALPLVRSPRSGDDGVIYEFEGFRLDPSNHLLTREGKEQALPGRAFDVLLMLLRSPGDLLTKDDLLACVWKGSFVEESNLTVAISTLRRALNEDPHDRRYIHTVARRGYRFVAEVRLVANVRDKTEWSTGAMADAAPTQVLLTVEEVVPEQVFAPQQAFHEVAAVPAAKVLRWRSMAAAGGLLAASLLIGCWLLLRAPEPIRSLAVLPISAENKASEAVSLEDQVVLLGITDGLISRLDPELVVRPTSAVLRYSESPGVRSGTIDPLAAGREQGVDAIMTGTAGSSSVQLTLELRLIRVRDGRTLWHGHFAEEPNHLSQLQQDGGDAAARIMHRYGALAGTTKQVQSTSSRNHSPAYQLYLRGRYFWNLRTVDGLSKSADYFREAIAIDPNYAPAYAGLADSYALATSLFVMPGKAANVEARSAALSAIELDPTLADPHASLGLIYFYIDWNLPAAEREFERSIQLNPNYVMAHYWYALDLAAQGRFPEAMYEVHLTERLEPLSLTVGTHAATVEYLARDYESARRDLQRVLELDPNFARARARLGMVELETGETTAAITELTRALALCKDDDPWIEGLLGYALARSGSAGGAERMLDRLQQKRTAHYVPANSVGLVLLGLGRRQEAITAFSEAVQDHSTTMVVAKVDPTLDALRNDPAFVALLASIKR